MALHREPSVLSDDLKPRRTPVPSSLEESMPRPSVPDLSIIETAGSSYPRPILPDAHPQPPLTQLSYNDWRVKVSGGALNGVSSNGHRYSSVTAQEMRRPQPSFNPVTSDLSGVQRNISAFYRTQVGNGSSAPHNQPGGQVVSYSDIQKRPTSAPVARPSQGVSGITSNHPLSKSAPSRRVSLQNDNQSPGGITSASSKHLQGLSPALPQKLNQNPPSSPGKYTFYAPQGQNSAAIMVKTSANSHPIESRGTPNHYMQSNGGIPNGSEISVVPGDHIKYHSHDLCNQLPNASHHSISTLARENMHHIGPTGCCQGYSFQNRHSQWAYDGQGCCPSAIAVAPLAAANHMHPNPSCGVQHSSAASAVSYDDLYKIVLAQNDQLKVLQNQVQRLLLTQEEQKALIEPPTKEMKGYPDPKPCSRNNLVAEEGTQTSDYEVKEDDSQKMSIGVMTSFIHAVTYRGRLDPVHNVSEPENNLSNGNCSKQSKSSSSDDYSSSPSPKAKASTSNQRPPNNCRACCEDCSSNERTKKLEKKGKSNRKSLAVPRNKKLSDSNGACTENCQCNNPGMSAAITAVRGCQAVLASRAGGATHEFSTFNGADLPTVTEQPLTPMTSMHVDLHDYNSSSSDEPSSPQSSEEATSEEDEKNPSKGSKHNGWTFYNNVLGQVNQILEDRDVASWTSPSSGCNAENVAVPQPQKQTDISVSKRVAFEALKGKDAPQNLKELALRFLRENHPEELASSSDSPKAKNSGSEKVQEMALYNMPASNMSFATFRYLERYNLLPENFNPQQYLEAATNIHGFNGKHENTPEMHHIPMDRGLPGVSRKPPRNSSGKPRHRSSDAPHIPSSGDHHHKHIVRNGHAKPSNTPGLRHLSPRKQPHSNTPTSKILDITTLRQQPKLL